MRAFDLDAREGFLEENSERARKHFDRMWHAPAYRGEPLWYRPVVLPNTKAAFDALLAHAQEVCPGLRVRLVVDPRAGQHGGRACARAYAYCTPDPKAPKRPRKGRKRATGEAFVVAVAPKIEDADDGRMEGLICHELAHAVLLHLGYDEHTERDADACAEQLFDVCIYYDADDVQTTDGFAPMARRPRPPHLDDEDGFTRTT